MASKTSKDLFRLFFGLDRAHGVYNPGGQVERGEKVQGRAMTVSAPLTPELWSEHLKGKKGLGIVPIRDDNTCGWGAIDVDKYTIQLEDISRQLADEPFVVCRSKSGGAHIYVFVSEPVPAAEMKAKLGELSQAIGYGNSEIFPKQSELRPGDVGNWINMPYFGGRDTTRYAIQNGQAIPEPAQFVKLILSKMMTPGKFRAFTIKADPLQVPLPEGPPCLQHLAHAGFPPGTRNNGLFNLGVYLKKVSSDGWERELEEYNRRYMNPPLLAEEVMVVVKSLRKKDYQYKCKDEPICNHCAQDLCRSRKYGVGGEDFKLPVLSSLTKIDTVPPSYYLDVDNVRIGPIRGEDLFQQSKFQKVCFERVNIMTAFQKATVWRHTIQKLLDTMNVVSVPADNSPQGILWQYIEQFALQRAKADSKEDLLRGMPWRHENRVYFRMKDLMEFLERKKFREFKPPVIAAIFRGREDCDHVGLNIKGKFVNVWVVPAPEEPEELEPKPTGQSEY